MTGPLRYCYRCLRVTEHVGHQAVKLYGGIPHDPCTICQTPNPIDPFVNRVQETRWREQQRRREMASV